MRMNSGYKVLEITESFASLIVTAYIINTI